MQRYIDSILSAVGNTPLLRLGAVSDEVDANIYLKIEYLNPSGSLKDRIAVRMIEDAEKGGRLAPGHTIVESSTGNTGTALSFVGALKGYRVLIYETTPGKVGAEKIKIMTGYGAEVRSLPPEEPEHTDRAVFGYKVEMPGRQKCLELEQQNPTIWWARQFSNPSNPAAQADMAREFLAQLPEGTVVGGFVASIGTGGTLRGCGEILRVHNPDCLLYGVVPFTAKKDLELGKHMKSTPVHGGLLADMVNEGFMNQLIRIKDEDAVTMTRRLRREEGLFAGISTGANVLAAMRLCRDLGKGSTVVTIAPDNADRYFTTEHYVT
ncbi:MAG: cysteine synthase family protein [Desulfovibrio sp.]|jgi:cysteine synthase A|nr:cysteine synthase family protein [Desulfovibrio sp.]